MNKLNVGRLVPNTEAQIIDVNTKRPVGVNQRGELLVRGPQVMLGYLKNDEANAQAFAPDMHDEHRFFKSGDIASFDQDGTLCMQTCANNTGYITLHDRVKDIIKYNGYQVAASEIETIVNSLPFVLESAVVAKVVKDDVSHNELPWACIVMRPDKTSLSEKELTKQVLDTVNSRVSGYKKLRGVSWTDQLPKKYVHTWLLTTVSTSGKVLKRELRKQLSVTDS